MIPTTPETPVEKIPLLSLQTWDNLLQTLPTKPSTDQPSLIPDLWRSLRLSHLHGYQQIMILEDDHWVFQYEHFQETLAKQGRKKGAVQNGVFYTPPPIAKYLTERTLGIFLASTAEQIQSAWKNNDFSLANQQWAAIQPIQVIDPACGTGVFLVEAMKLFYQFYKRVEMLTPDFALENPAHHIFTHHLAGMDIDPLSVMITEFRLAQWANRLDGQICSCKPEDLSFHIGDTLQDTPDNFGDNASQQSQANTLKKPVNLQAHFILGNPPYITEVRKQSDRFRALQASTSKYYQAKMDLCDAFLVWGLDHLQPGGQLAYVLPAYWTQRSSTASIRKRLWKEGCLKEIWSFEDACLFPNAPGHHTGLLIWQKHSSVSSQRKSELCEQQSDEQTKKEQAQDKKNINFGKAASTQELQTQNLKSYRIMREPKSEKFLLGDTEAIALLSKLSEIPPLFLPENIQQGLVIPQGRLKPRDKIKLPQSVQTELSTDSTIDPGIFLLTADEIESLKLNMVEQNLLRPFYRPIHFTAFQGFSESEPQERIIYTDLHNRRALESLPNQYPNLRSHLDRFNNLNTSDFAPYGLHRPRQAEWFEDNLKILAPRQVFLPAFAAIPFPAYVNEGFLVIRSSQDPHWLCALLNSDLARFWFYHQKRKGHRLQIDKEVLCRFPQPINTSPEIRQACMKLAQQLANSEISPAERFSSTSELNLLVNQAYELNKAEIAALTAFQTTVKTLLAAHKNSRAFTL